MIRFRMGWLQLRRFLSFLPAAFFVYILLHYLIYQPIIPDSQTFIAGDRITANESSIDSLGNLKSIAENGTKTTSLDFEMARSESASEGSTIAGTGFGASREQNVSVKSRESPKIVINDQQRSNSKGDLEYSTAQEPREKEPPLVSIQDIQNEVEPIKESPSNMDSYPNYENEGNDVRYPDLRQSGLPNYPQQMSRNEVDDSHNSININAEDLKNLNPVKSSDFMYVVDNRISGEKFMKAFDDKFKSFNNHISDLRPMGEEPVIAALDTTKYYSYNRQNNVQRIHKEDKTDDVRGRSEESIIVPRELLSKEEKFQSRKEENLSMSGSTITNGSGSKSSTPVKESLTSLPLPKGGLLNEDSQPEAESLQEKTKEGSQSAVAPQPVPAAAKEPQTQKDDTQGQQQQQQQPDPKKEPSQPQKPNENPAAPKKVVPAPNKITAPRRPPPSPTGFAIDSLKGKITIGEKYEKGFTTPHEELCPNNGRDLKVLILITTAPDHERHRNAVRQTWGHFALRKDVAIGFMVGRTSRGDVQTVIDKENDRYGDIIEANFVDHYSNLTLKTVSMFEWAKTYCSEARFVLKTDDDMFINVPLLLAFINAKRNERRAIFGRLAKGWKPVRNKKSKYYIDTATYGRVRYPDFLTGPAYLFTNDVVEEIYNKALNTTFFVLEDVLLTGFVGESLKVKRVGDSHFRNEKIKLTDTCKLMQSISIHMVKYEEQFDIYKRTLDGKTKCKTR